MAKRQLTVVTNSDTREQWAELRRVVGINESAVTPFGTGGVDLLFYIEDDEAQIAAIKSGLEKLDFVNCYDVGNALLEDAEAALDELYELLDRTSHAPTCPARHSGECLCERAEIIQKMVDLGGEV